MPKLPHFTRYSKPTVVLYSRAWYGMERNFRYGIWKMPEWNGMEDFKNGMEDNLPYFHTRFCSLYLQKNTYRCWVVINNIVTEVFNFNFLAYYLSTNAVHCLCTLCKQCTYCIIVSTLQFNCSIDVTVDDLNRFDCFVFFVLRLTICPVVYFVFLHHHENSYLIFHPRFSSFSFIIFLVFKLIAIFFLC